MGHFYRNIAQLTSHPRIDSTPCLFLAGGAGDLARPGCFVWGWVPYGVFPSRVSAFCFLAYFQVHHQSQELPFSRWCDAVELYPEVWGDDGIVGLPTARQQRARFGGGQVGGRGLGFRRASQARSGLGLQSRYFRIIAGAPAGIAVKVFAWMSLTPAPCRRCPAHGCELCSLDHVLVSAWAPIG